MTSRLVVSLRRRGAGETAKRVAAKAGRVVLLRERHSWYALDLRSERPSLELPPAIELVPADPGNAHLYEALPSVTRSLATKRLAGGVEGWLALEGGRPAFGCWLFRGRVPILAARGGFLELPPGFVCLEDSVTAPAFRGRGIAPAVWSLLADRVEAAGGEWLITKIEWDNTAVRRALEKVGFASIGEMGFVRVGPYRRRSVSVEPGSPGEVVASLA